MSKRVIKVTSDQLNNLLKELRSPLVGDHLSDDEVLDYARGELPADEKVPINHHLEACTDCRAKMEWFQKERQAWEGTSGQDRLATLRRQILEGKTNTAKASLSQRIKQGLLPQYQSLKDLIAGFSIPGNIPGLATRDDDKILFAGAKPYSKRAVSEDGTVYCIVRATDNAENLSVRVGSHRPELEGVALRLSAVDSEDEQKVTILDELVLSANKLAPDEVVAEYILNRETRKRLPKRAYLKVELILEPLYSDEGD